jgi:hypothetical protein
MPSKINTLAGNLRVNVFDKFYVSLARYSSAAPPTVSYWRSRTSEPWYLL